MSDSEFLKPDELRDLTGFSQAGKQHAWLTERGIPHQRDSGRIIVSRFHTRAWLQGRPVTASNAPNLDAIRRA